MLPSNAPKRARTSETDEHHHYLQTQLQSFQQHQQQTQQLLNPPQQHKMERQLFQQQQQQPNQLFEGFSSLPSMGSSSIPVKQSNEPEEPLTEIEIQRLEKVTNVLIESIVPTKTQQAQEVVTNVINNSLSSHSAKSSSPIPKDKTSKNENTNSIVLDFPILAEPNSEAKPLSSPLSMVLNHTFPNSLVELVDKLKKMSINPASLELLNPNSSVSSSPEFPTNNSSSSQSSASLPPPPPSEELIKQLINDYFYRFNVIVPIMDRRKFQDLCTKNTSNHTKLLLNSILAVAARFSDDPSIQKSEEKPGGIFFDAAKKLLDNMYDTPKLETLQALLLLSNSEVSVTRINSAAMFLGMAVQMSHLLNLGRNESALLTEEEEEKRRVFYCLYCCDRWTSFMFGKPSLIEDININIPLPTLASFEVTTRSFFVSWIKLSRILGEIWKFGYSSKQKARSVNWIAHMADQKSTLRQIRAALAKWLKELPDELQYQYLPNTDPQSLIQLTRFSDFAGHINLLFHICMIVLHQPYLSQAKIEIQNQGPNGPINTCLTAAITITDIAKTTRKYDKDAFRNFQYTLYGLLQASSILGTTTMNDANNYEPTAKKALHDAIAELKYAAESSKVMSMQEIVKELEGVMRIANSNSSDIAIPFPLVLQILESRGSNNTGGGLGNVSLRGMSAGHGFGNNKLSSPPVSEYSTASNSSNTQDDENSLKIKYSSPPNLTDSTPISLSPSLSHQQTDPNAFIFNTQDQSSLQFNQISTGIDQHMTQDAIGAWNPSSYFLNDSLYEFQVTANSQIPTNSMFSSGIIASARNNNSNNQQIDSFGNERTS